MPEQATPAFVLYDGTRTQSVLFDATPSDIPALANLWVEVTVAPTGFALDWREQDRAYGRKFNPSLLDAAIRPLVEAAIESDDFSGFRSCPSSGAQQGVADLDRLGRYTVRER